MGVYFCNGCWEVLSCIQDQCRGFNFQLLPVLLPNNLSAVPGRTYSGTKFNIARGHKTGLLWEPEFLMSPFSPDPGEKHRLRRPLLPQCVSGLRPDRRRRLQGPDPQTPGRVLHLHRRHSGPVGGGQEHPREAAGNSFSRSLGLAHATDCQIRGKIRRLPQ